jgi:hypothetical protein
MSDMPYEKQNNLVIPLYPVLASVIVAVVVLATWQLGYFDELESVERPETIIYDLETVYDIDTGETVIQFFERRLLVIKQETLDGGGIEFAPIDYMKGDSVEVNHDFQMHQDSRAEWSSDFKHEVQRIMDRELREFKDVYVTYKEMDRMFIVHWIYVV